LGIALRQRLEKGGVHLAVAGRSDDYADAAGLYLDASKNLPISWLM
jgi:hypothetical protein